MVADRRDLMVETYSSYCGTGAAAMVCGLHRHRLRRCLRRGGFGAGCKRQHCEGQTLSDPNGKPSQNESSNAKNSAETFAFLSPADSSTSLPDRRGQEKLTLAVTLGCDGGGGCFTNFTPSVASVHQQNYFSGMASRFHPPVGVGGPFQRKGGVDNGTKLSAIEQWPHFLLDGPCQRRLFRYRTGAKG